MKRIYSRNKKKRIPTKYMLLAMTLLCIVSIFASLILNISGGPLNGVAGYVFVPMQKGINSIGLWANEKTETFRNLKDVIAENEQLKAQVDDLTNQLMVNKLEQYELDNYRELLELDEKYPSYDKVAANVIAKDSGNWFSVFTIDKGANDGIAPGMNVIAGSGLVGIVTDVGPNFAKIRTVINDSNKVSGMVTTTNDNLTVCGNLQTMNQESVITFQELRDTDNEVKIGDPVVTSYISDRYQQGILIGYINTIEENSNNLTKSGTITPVVDFEHIEEVLVIKEIKVVGDDSQIIQDTEE